MADVVLIHGAGDSAAVWDHQLAALGAEHRLVALDLPGHGARMAEPAHADHAANAREVAAAIEQAGQQHAIVVGHSMGGAVALTYALGEGGGSPDRLRALVLVATGARLRMHPTFLEAARQRAEEAPRAPLGEPLVPVERCLAAGASPALVEWLRMHSGQATAQAVYADFQANDAFDVMGRLGEIRVPTLVIGGADDTMAPAKFVQYLADNIPGAQIELIANAAHYPQAEQAEAFNRRLGEFLKNVG
jgi:pimeloyl-ACP methyl ester carboxylesterase